MSYYLNHKEIGLYVSNFENIRKSRLDHYRYLEDLRNQFVNRFSIMNISNMEIEDYVEGREIQGQTNKDTFCYWIEWKAEELGMIRNSPAIKFGVYIDKKTQEYFYLKKYLSAQEAFNAKKREILKLLEIAPKKDLKLIKLIDLTPMFKGKILFIYNPDIYLNIFSESYIDYFLQQLGIYNQNKELDILEKREVLIAINEEIGIWNTYEYTDFLYTEFGNPPKRTD